MLMSLLQSLGGLLLFEKTQETPGAKFLDVEYGHAITVVSGKLLSLQIDPQDPRPNAPNPMPPSQALL